MLYPRCCQAIVTLLSRLRDNEISVKVKRIGAMGWESTVALTLKPQQWSGEGLLGCHIQPLEDVGELSQQSGDWLRLHPREVHHLGPGQGWPSPDGSRGSSNS